MLESKYKFQVFIDISKSDVFVKWRRMIWNKSDFDFLKKKHGHPNQSMLTKSAESRMMFTYLQCNCNILEKCFASERSVAWQCMACKG